MVRGWSVKGDRTFIIQAVSICITDLLPNQSKKKKKKKAWVLLKWDINGISKRAFSCQEFGVSHTTLYPPQSSSPCVLTAWPVPHSDFWTSAAPSGPFEALADGQLWGVRALERTLERPTHFCFSSSYSVETTSILKPTPNKYAQPQLSLHSSKFTVTRGAKSLICWSGLTSSGREWELQRGWPTYDTSKVQL